MKGFAKPILIPLLSFLAPALAAASAAVNFTAQVDRAQITQDDSVSLKLSVRTEGATAVEPPNFSAPDFDLVNEFTGAFVESYYENGRFGARNTQQITKVLRPRKTGDLKITDIAIRVNGQVFTAPPITVRVDPAGQGTPPPPQHGGGGVGLRGAKRLTGAGFFVRAEVDKNKIYKGEQLIVSYYLYRRVRVFNIQVTKYPTLNGFLREDLDMPILGQRLDSEAVVLDGVPYERSLLARYAAYPLKEGKLSIDAMAIKANYYAMDAFEEEDPFTNFFRQMAPRQGTSRSDLLNVEVSPLPLDGRPASFSGGVGELEIVSAVDKYEVRANESVTLKVKVEGRGNFAALGEPKAKWPENVELYESKGNSKAGRGGVGEKIFEFVLIPRVPGKMTLPAMELSYFDPAKNAYVTKTTEPIDIQVGEAAPGSAAPPARSAQPSQSRVDIPAEEQPRGLRNPETTPSLIRRSSDKIWDTLSWVGLGGILLAIVWMLVDTLRRGVLGARVLEESRRAKRRVAESKSWQKLEAQARAARQGAAWIEVAQAYESLSGAVYDAIDRAYGIGARSLSRSELRSLLVEERSLAEPVWNKVERLLEFAEAVRFAISAGAVSEAAAREQLENWVAEGRAIESGLARTPAKTSGGNFPAPAL